jgi:hypothetical protein
MTEVTTTAVFWIFGTLAAASTFECQFMLYRKTGSVWALLGWYFLVPEVVEDGRLWSYLGAVSFICCVICFGLLATQQ